MRSEANSFLKALHDCVAKDIKKLFHHLLKTFEFHPHISLCQMEG